MTHSNLKASKINNTFKGNYGSKHIFVTFNFSYSTLSFRFRNGTKWNLSFDTRSSWTLFFNMKVAKSPEVYRENTPTWVENTHNIWFCHQMFSFCVSTFTSTLDNYIIFHNSLALREYILLSLVWMLPQSRFQASVRVVKKLPFGLIYGSVLVWVC